MDGLEDVDVDAAGSAGLAVMLFLVLWCVFMFDALDADNAGVDVCAAGAEAEGGRAARRAGGNSRISSSSSSSRSRLRSRIGTMGGGATRDDEDASDASDLGSS
jgi:hypothetical protein